MKNKKVKFAFEMFEKEREGFLKEQQKPSYFQKGDTILHEIKFSMVKTILALLLLFCSVLVSAQSHKDFEMSYQKFKASENKLNATYNQLLKEYKNNPIFVKYLKKAQTAWLLSIKADYLMMYPEAETDKAFMLWGSGLQLCTNDFYINCNNNRTNYLKKWLKISKKLEQDCTGSMHDFDNKY